MQDWPAPGWVVHEVDTTLEIRVVNEMPGLSAALEAEIDRLWAAAQLRTEGKLFNGRVFNADTIAPERVGGHWTEYRRIVAQMDRPELWEDLRLRPVAVGGTIMGPEGVVIGRRPTNAVYQAGMWQLPPAGSLDFGAAAPDGRVDFIHQILAELGEELGLAPGTVRVLRPLCLVEHADSHVTDLGVALTTHLDTAAIARAHANAPDAEYDPLIVVPVTELAGFVERAGLNLTPQARVFLAHVGLLGR